MLVLLLISRVILEYIKVTSKPTEIDVGQQNTFMVSVNMVTIFFSFYLFKLLNKFIVMPDIEEILWHREKYLQSQLFTMTHDMNSLTDLYCSKYKGYRK